MAVLLIAACRGGTGAAGGSEGTTAAPRTLTVFAASSLGNAFTELAAGFEAEHPGVTVELSFGSSTDLAAQIASEGTADVFASASEAAMDTLATTTGVADRIDIATNPLVIVTPEDDPAGVGSLADLARPGVQVILGAEGVPVGDYAREVLSATGILDPVLANVVSFEPDNASVVTKLASGEADAGIVYRSDLSAAAGNALRSVAIPEEVNVVATYPIAVVEGSEVADLATAFVAFVTSPAGRSVLAEYGFGAPPA